MPALSDYTAGTITLTNGSVNFTGSGTGWQAADFREGDTILGIEDHAGVEYVIASITGNGAGTLTQEWEGATGTYQYRMRYMADGARVTAQARNLIELLGNGNLQAEAAIDGTGGNWLSYFTGAGAKARTAFTAAARSLVGLTGAANKLPYFTDANTAALTDFGAAARSLLGLPAAENKVPYYTDANTAALTDLTAKGRAILSKADNAAVLGEIGAQPADSDLTAIAALTTTAFGRNLLTLADQAALRAAANAVNKAGDTMTGALQSTGRLSLDGYTPPDVNSPILNIRQFGDGWVLRARTWGNGNYSGLFYDSSGHAEFQARSHDGTSMSAYRANGCNVAGPVVGTSKSFEIDHPADPANYDLRHASTEAPELLVEYRGVVQLVDGQAVVDIEAYFNVMPGTFVGLWADACVMSVQNQDGFDRVRPSRVNGATFTIASENPASNGTVTWLVMARRNDAFVRWNGCNVTDGEGRLIIEIEKEDA